MCADNVKESTHCASSALSTHFFSADGKDWQCADVEPYGHTVPYTDGNHTYTTLERPNILFDSVGQMTVNTTACKRLVTLGCVSLTGSAVLQHLVLAADLVTGDEGCAAHGRCRKGEKPPCATACTNCKYTDRAGTIVVALKSDDTAAAAADDDYADEVNKTACCNDFSRWAAFSHRWHCVSEGKDAGGRLEVGVV
jgi:hypothetical protein